MPLSKIIAMLRQTIGLDIESVGISLIKRAVKQRINTSQLREDSQYADLLESSPSELQRLVEAVVIPETFFFRHPEAFDALRQGVRDFPSGSFPIRVLSAPCSTGEEPYSIAMSLFDAGLTADKFQIDAIDISSPLLDLASLGLFGSNSFRGNDLGYRERHFHKTAAGYQISDQVRQSVQFKQGNVLEPSFRSAQGPYDFIFFRNLLIYFDSSAQKQSLKMLKHLLAANGLLFVGSAETMIASQQSFVSTKFPMGFSFRKSEALFPLMSKRPASWAGLARKTDRKTSGQPALMVAGKAALENSPMEEKAPPDLTHAEKLADRGELHKAAELCEVSLSLSGPSARAYHLLGLIRDCMGDQNLAGDLYRRALYLEPDFYDALIHLALLKGKSGDNVAAKALKNRAFRVLEDAK
jgi:chemotaxis protein methyltransferase WspC